MAVSRKNGRPVTKKTGVATTLGQARLRPQRSSAPVQVSAQAAYYHNDPRLFVAVSVHEQDGSPVTGLTKARFKLWELGPMFGEVSLTTVVAMDSLPTLAGHYHLVKHNWGLATTGTIAFCVQVLRNGKLVGSTLTALVKVQPGGPN